MSNLLHPLPRKVFPSDIKPADATGRERKTAWGGRTLKNAAPHQNFKVTYCTQCQFMSLPKTDQISFGVSCYPWSLRMSHPKAKVKSECVPSDLKNVLNVEVTRGILIISCRDQHGHSTHKSEIDQRCKDAVNKGKFKLSANEFFVENDSKSFVIKRESELSVDIFKINNKEWLPVLP